jgi:hypothetical protein
MSTTIMEIKKVSKIITSVNNAMYIITMTFIQLIKILSEIKTPEMQTDLSLSKISGMKESYYKYPHHFGSRALITIAHVNMNGLEEYFLVDGQHRVEMIKELVAHDKNDNILVAFITVTTEKEFEDLFADINSDSLKYNLSDFSVFNKKIYKLLKKKINLEYLPKISMATNTLYTSSQFIELIISKKIMEFVKDKTALTIIQKNDDTYMANIIYAFLITKEKEFFVKCNYENMYVTSKDIFSDDEQKSILAKNCMFMINNNFVNWLFDETITPIHYYKTLPSFDEMIKKSVWRMTFGQKRLPQKCYIDGCENMLTKDNYASWGCGYIKHIVNGGTIVTSNMKAVCMSCSHDMYEMKLDIDDWSNELINREILKYFTTPTIKCPIRKCTHLITKDNFIRGDITGIDKKTSYKPICTNH